MHTSALTTKFHIPPQRVGIVARPLLLEQLDTSFRAGRKLTIVSPPAGYGKTTLVTEWLANLQSDNEHPHLKISWLSLDPSDDQPGRFFTYFVAALNRLDDSFGADLFATLQDGQIPQPDSLVTFLVNEMLAWKSRHILVLDDFHSIQDRIILDALTSILSQHVPNFHLVMATREDPPLPLARWRAGGQLTELRAADLRFTPAEAAEFLNQAMGLNLSVGDVAALKARTEGWIAGLQLAALALQRPLSIHGPVDVTSFVQEFTGSHRYVLDYLVEEVLQHQSEPIRNFLLQTSILERLNGNLCNAVTGRSDGKSVLETLDRNNLFLLPLDDQRQWYRYHHLFADVLQTHLMEAQPERVVELHQLASIWYEKK